MIKLLTIELGEGALTWSRDLKFKYEYFAIYVLIYVIKYVETYYFNYKSCPC